jgi:hypothetical protein
MHVRSCTVTTRRPRRCGSSTAFTEWNTSTGPRYDSTVGMPRTTGIIGTRYVNNRFETDRTSTSRRAGGTRGGATRARAFHAFRNKSE